MEPYKNSLLSRFLCDFTQIWRLFRNLFVLLGFCPSALASLLVLFRCQKEEIIFHPLLQTSLFVCLFVTKTQTERTPELLTNNAKRKEKNRKE